MFPFLMPQMKIRMPLKSVGLNMCFKKIKLWLAALTEIIVFTCIIHVPLNTKQKKENILSAKIQKGIYFALLSPAENTIGYVTLWERENLMTKNGLLTVKQLEILKKPPYYRAAFLMTFAFGKTTRFLRMFFGFGSLLVTQRLFTGAYFECAKRSSRFFF